MSQSKFARLVDLARMPDSHHRRELLREITDLFFTNNGPSNQSEANLFDDVLRVIAAEMQEGVLADLAESFADAENAPAGLMRDLANRAFAVSEPILRRSRVLDEQTLLQVVSYQSQAHIKAVAQRQSVSQAVSDAIVRLGDDSALDTLLRNDGAMIARASMETAIGRAKRSEMLHHGLVNRRDLPLDLLNDMYFAVATGLRTQILERNSSVDPDTLDAALAKSRERMRKSMGELSAEAKHAFAFIQSKKASGELNAPLLMALYREAKITHFLYGLAELTCIDYATAAELIERKDIDALAMICRAADIDRPLFVTLAVLAFGGDQAMSRAEEFGRMYNAVPVEAAQRAMRFYKVRHAAAESRAA